MLSTLVVSLCLCAVVLFAVLCGPVLSLSVLYCADLTMLIQCSKLLGLQPPA